MASIKIAAKMAERGAQSSKTIWMFVLLSCFITVRTQNVEFSDEIAGSHIDFIADKGIKLLLLWRQRFMTKMDAIRDILDEKETILTEHFSSDTLPNTTAFMENNLHSITDTLDQAEDILNSLNFTEKEELSWSAMTEMVYGETEAHPAFLTTSSNTVNVGDHYDSTTFVAPRDGLYLVTIRSNFLTTAQTLKVMKNGANTLTKMEPSSYFDVQIRYALVELVEGDEITTTISGSTPSLFAVNLLRLQTLMPSLL